jgi:flagellar protein FliS
MSMSANVVSSTTSVASNEVNAMTPYQVITLLLDGALERIDQAIGHISAGDVDDAAILVQKAVGIVGGLRESLDLNKGGEIADNLDALYEYITVRLETMTTDSPLETLGEVKNLLQEVHDGWSGIGASLDTP